MKKKPITLLLFAFLMNGVYSQTAKEWTQQKKTQLEYLIQQLAALQSYGHVVETGYAITQKGLDLIQNIKKGDFTLHAAFFSSLGQVSPQVKTYWKVAAIIAMQTQMLQQCKLERNRLGNGGINPAFQINYYNTVIGTLLRSSETLLNNLTTILTDGILQMNDEQRLRRIDNLYSDILEQRTFLQHFCVDMNGMRIQQNHERTSSTVLREWSINH